MTTAISLKSIGTKIQLLAAAAFLAGLAGVLSYQTYTRIEATWQERLDANFRIVYGLSGTASGAIASQNKAVISSYMELLKSDPRAAGVVISAGNKVIESQQSIDHFEMPVAELSALALEVEAGQKPQVLHSGDYEFIAVPVKGPASRTIGSIAVAWNVKGLLDNVWQTAINEAMALIGVVALVLLVLFGALRRLVTGPLKKIAAQFENTTEIANSTSETAIAQFESRPDEIGTFARALGRFYRDAAEKHRLHHQLAHLASHDALTCLPNRRHFEERLEDVLRDGNAGREIAVLFLDLDRFKIVNDTLGHAAGDALLKAVAGRLASCARQGDIICRLGGDEFAILQRSGQQPAGAEALALRITQSLSDPVVIEENQAKIGVSIGIAISPRDGTDAAALLKNADMAVYQAKTGGRNIHRFYTQDMSENERQRRKLEMELRKALEAEQFELHYQPAVDVQTNRITGFEALVRWRHPELGLIPPGQFIPIAEDTGFIVQLGEWIIREACREAAKWPAHIRVAVNISAVQLQRGELALTVFGALAASRLAAGRLELEITESALLRDDDTTAQLLETLRGFGVRLALDDFGTGYSALSYLNRFSFDKIKIDRAFISGLDGNSFNGAVIEAVVGLSRSLNLSTVAEGVETETQRRLLKAAGIAELQGYLVSKPRTGEEVREIYFSENQREVSRASA